MLIDWFTVGAQAINFIILVWLMKRFLYQPVLDAIAAREKKIAAQLADAEAIKTEATQQQREFKEKNEMFERERAAKLQKAKDDAETEGQRLRAEAINAANAARVASAKALVADTERLHAEIIRQTQQQVFDIARRVLGDLADVGLEQRACEVFIQRLKTLDSGALDTLKAALTETSETNPAILRSAFELQTPEREAVHSALQDRFGQAVALRFETVPELVSGIELSIEGQKLAWSIADYLNTLSTTPNTGSAESDSENAA